MLFSHWFKIGVLCFDLGVLIGMFRLYRRPIRALRELWLWSGIGGPRPQFSLFYSQTKAYNQGRRLFLRSIQPLTTQSGSAEKLAAQNVRRLAPEVSVMDGELYTSQLIVRSNGLIDRQQACGYCCENTFRRDRRVPDLEKSLTFYLYWKLFPKRFSSRPHHYD